MRDWRDWTLEDWNLALFDYFFVSGGQGSGPVFRLSIGAEDYARILGRSDANPDEVTASFLAVVRKSPPAFKRKLSESELENGEWRATSPPPFFVFLVFTCYVASSVNSETITIGDFRQRLRVLLKHPEGTQYPLEHLAQLWLALYKWLETCRKRGMPYRSLALPDPGRMNRIGYSVGLAFPLRRDRVKLINTFANAGLDNDPPISEILKLIGGRLSLFSKSFQAVFAKARRAYTHQDSRDRRELQTLISAVRETLSNDIVRNAVADKLKYRLILEINDKLEAELALLLDRKLPRPIKGVRIEASAAPLEDFQFLLRLEETADNTLLIDYLLAGAFDDLLPHFRRSPTRQTVSQGMLLFGNEGFGAHTLRTSRPQEGSVLALVRGDVAGPFLQSIPTTIRTKPSCYDGWTEVGPFDAAMLPSASNLVAELREIACLAETQTAEQLSLVGGIHLGIGYLGIRGVLPRLRANLANTVNAYRVHRSGNEFTIDSSFSLLKNAQDGFFDFPAGSDYDGHFNVVATRPNDTLARRVNFVARVLSEATLPPSKPSEWVPEFSRTVSLDPPFEVDYPLTEHDRAAALTPTHSGGRPRLATNAVSEIHPGAEKLMEVLLAILSARRGLPEGECAALFSSLLRFDERCTWDVLRSWQEAGYLDLYARRRWRGRVFFGRPPRLVVSRGAWGSRATLVGLTSYGLRARLSKAFADRNAIPLPSGSINRYVPPLYSWEATLTTIDEVARDVEIRIAALSEPLEQMARPIRDFHLNDSSPPSHYELRASWDWSFGGFLPKPKPTTNEVEVRWFNRPDRPDYFLVEKNEKEIHGWTYSRNWALLAAFAAAGIGPYKAVNSQVLRSVAVGPYLPLAVARGLAIESGTTPGRADDLPQEPYLYLCPPEFPASRLIAALWGVNHGTDNLVRSCAWLLTQARAAQRQPGLIPMPADIRNWLRALSQVPQAAELAKLRIPLHLMFHVRAFVHRFTL